MKPPIMSALLPIELTNGNDGRTKRWFSSAKRRQEYEELLIAHGLRREPLDVPVWVRVTRVLGKGQRLWDYSSGLRGNWKEIEDALVSVGWFHDDGPKWVTAVQFVQNKTSRDRGPATLVEVFR